MPAGRPRKPSALKRLSGENRPSQINRNEPQYGPVLPPVPASLSPVARDEWERAALILYNARVLTNADLAILRGYVVSFAWAFEAEQKVMKEGVTIVALSHKGVLITKENPAFNAFLKAEKQMLEFARELGLTPASRTKIQSAPEETRAPLAELRERLASIEGGKRDQSRNT